MSESKKSRPDKLTPVKDVVREKNGWACWRVSVPASYSMTGKRTLKYFTSYKKALEFISELKAAKVASDAGLKQVTKEQGLDAQVAAQALEGTGLTLTEACRFVRRLHDTLPASLHEIECACRIGLEQIRLANASPTFSEAAWEMVRVKEKILRRRERTLEQIRYMLRRIENICPDFCVKPVGVITADDCRAAFNKAFLTPIQADKARGIFSGVWALAIRRGWASVNPTKALDVLHKQEAEITALKPEEVRRLLTACGPSTGNDNGQDLTCIRPAVAILAFAGIRPEELQRLVWEDIDLEEGVISVRGMNAKTGGARHVTILPVLKSWLELVPVEARSGAVVSAYWRKRWEEARRRAGWVGAKKWPKDALRHTYATYHVKQFQDFSLLQVEMGHRSAELLRSRYMNMRGVTKADAIVFWELFVNEVTPNLDESEIVSG